VSAPRGGQLWDWVGGECPGDRFSSGVNYMPETPARVRLFSRRVEGARQMSVEPFSQRCQGPRGFVIAEVSLFRRSRPETI